MRVLIVRLSSMGDIVQTLPALTDASISIPGIRFDWAIDAAFAEIPSWHASVEQVIACPPRRWGKDSWNSLRNGHFSCFVRKLRQIDYDLIIDMQAEIKSAIVARLAKGMRCSYDSDSAHEWGAQFLYQRNFFVPKGKHSIERMRQLMASVFGYSLSSDLPEYGINRAQLPSVKLDFQNPYLVFIHSTSWQSKIWPEFYWRELVSKAVRSGFSVLLPWGNRNERERAGRIAAGQNQAIVLPDLSISEKASIIAKADATVGCDTGLSHIAAALNIPSVSLYGATDASLTGATGMHQKQIMSDFECVKCHRPVCTYQGAASFKPACFSVIDPERVWSELVKITSSQKHEAAVKSTAV